MGRKKKYQRGLENGVTMDDLFNDPTALANYLSGFQITESHPQQMKSRDKELEQLAEQAVSAMRSGNNYQRNRSQVVTPSTTGNNHQRNQLPPIENVTRRYTNPTAPAQKPVMQKGNPAGKPKQVNLATVTFVDSYRSYLTLTDRIGNGNAIEISLTGEPEATFVNKDVVDTCLYDLYLAHRFCSIPDAVFSRADLEKSFEAAGIDYFENGVELITLNENDDVIFCYYCPEGEYERFANYIKSKIPEEYLADAITRAFVRVITTPFIEKIFADTDINFADDFYLTDKVGQEIFMKTISQSNLYHRLKTGETPDLDPTDFTELINAIFSELGEGIQSIHYDDDTSEDVDSKDEIAEAPDFQPYQQYVRPTSNQERTGVQNDNIPFPNTNNATVVTGVCGSDAEVNRDEENIVRGSSGTDRFVSEGQSDETSEAREGVSSRRGYREHDTRPAKETIQVSIPSADNGSGESKQRSEETPQIKEEKEEGKKDGDMVVEVITVGKKR